MGNGIPFSWAFPLGRATRERRGHPDPPRSSGALPLKPLPKGNCPFWNSQNRWWGSVVGTLNSLSFSAGDPAKRKEPRKIDFIFEPSGGWRKSFFWFFRLAHPLRRRHAWATEKCRPGTPPINERGVRGLRAVSRKPKFGVGPKDTASIRLSGKRFAEACRLAALRVSGKL
jgi:hypothetical protein